MCCEPLKSVRFHAKIFTNAHSHLYIHGVFRIHIHECARALYSTNDNSEHERFFFGCLWIVCTFAHLLVSIRAVQCNAVFSGHVPDIPAWFIHMFSFLLPFAFFNSFTAVLNAHIYLEHLQMLRLVQLPYHIGTYKYGGGEIDMMCFIGVCLPSYTF